MPYYGQGDYYGQGGFFSALGKIGKAVVGGAVGFATGGVGGAVAGAAGAFRNVAPAAPQQFPPQIPLPGPLVLQSPIAVQRQQTDRFSLELPPMGAGEMAPRGYRLNKTGYFLKSGEYVPPRSRWVKNRSRNFANGRALNRAISRTAGFNRLVKRSRKNLRALAKI